MRNHSFSRKVLIFFLFVHENICCGYSLEAPRQGVSNEYPQHMFSCTNKKILIWVPLLSAAMVIYNLFFDSEGIVVQVPVLEHTSVTGIFYLEKVLTSCSALTDWCGWNHLLHDSAPAHHSAMIIKNLEKHHDKTLTHPPFSPDLSSCYF